MSTDFKAISVDCSTNMQGEIIVSFKAESGDSLSARKCATLSQTWLQDPKKRLKIAVEVYKPKRSLNANAYMWELCGKIAEKIKANSEDVYRRLILDVGVFDDVEIAEKAIGLFAASWKGNGIGWLVEKVDGSDRDGFVVLRAYRGSSTYDRAQMTRLVDAVVDEAKGLGIETRTPDEIERMTQAWEAKHGKV